MKKINTSTGWLSPRRPKVDKQLPGETMVEFSGKGKNTKIKKVIPPIERKKMPGETEVEFENKGKNLRIKKITPPVKNKKMDYKRYYA